MSFQLISRW